jgi:choline dehydrogenase-like flavoprotein
VKGAEAVRERNASAWLLPHDGSRTNHRLRADMRRFAGDDEVDLVVVGAGAGAGVLTQRLARAGWRVVCLDSGPFWDPDRDWVSDERGAHVLYWTEPRQIGGGDPVPLGSNNSGRGVGGSMVHFAGYVPRFHPSDFTTRSVDGVGADWPIGYHDLRPYYEAIERELPVAGEPWPWGEAHRYEYMRDYVHWATLGTLCEYLPQAGNRVTLADETDRHGLPVAHFSYTRCDNDQRLHRAATASMEAILTAAGASEVMTIDRYAHLVGGARMATRAEDGVVDADHRVFGLPNLYVVDGSILPTQGAANPALTIMALAARAADRLVALSRRGLAEREVTTS